MNEIEIRNAAKSLKAEILLSDDAFPAPPDPVQDNWFAPTSQARIDERRVSQRYPAIAGRSWLGWNVGSKFEQTAAWIMNISASGCLLASDAAAPDDRSIWLRLDNPAVPDWAEVRVVGHHTGNSGILACRLVFRGTCPYEMIKAVAFDPGDKRLTAPDPNRSWSFNSW